MYCSNCGKEIKDDAQFCKYCGASVKKKNMVQPEIQEEVLEEAQPAKQPEEKPKKKSKAGIIIGILATVLVLAAGGAYLLFFRKTAIDLESYYEISLLGTNGTGKVEASINEEGVKKEMMQTASDEEKVNALIDSMEITADPEEGLSNDDEVKVEVNYDETIASELKLKLKNTTQTFSISDLPDAEVIDAFENVEIEYEGYSPSLKIKSITNTAYPQLTYEADKTENIQNGDTLTVTCTNDSEALAEEGYALAESSQQFVVDEQEVFTQIEQLTDTQLNNLINVAQSLLDTHTPYGEYRSYTSGKYTGIVIGCKGSATDAYVIFSRTITYNKTGKSITSYGVVKYSDLNLDDISYNASLVEHDFYNSEWKTNPDGFESLGSVISMIQDCGYDSLDSSEGISIN